MKQASEFIVYNINKNILNFRDIYNILLCKNNNGNIYSLKVYLFKCIFKNMNKNYLEFLESIKREQNINPLLNHDGFGNLFAQIENNHCYNFSFIYINNYEIYNKLSQIVDISLENIQNHPEYNNIVQFINNNNNNNNKYKSIELIYNILINKYIFDLHGNLGDNLSEKANKFIQFTERLNINIHQNSKKIINYLNNRNSFYQNILPKLRLPQNTNLNENILYILFFSIKLVISIQQFQNNIFSNFYRNNNNLIQYLANLFLPGAYPANNELIDSYYEIEDHLRNQPPNFAVYMCSCGKYYTISPCGFPMIISNCQKCGLQIGGTNHTLLRRPGHFRIFLDEQAKNNILLRWGFDRNMPSMTLRDFKREKIDPLINIPHKGIGKISKEIINKTGNNIRNINELSVSRI